MRFRKSGLRRIVVASAALVVIVGLSGCADSAFESENSDGNTDGPIKVGLMLPLSGVYAPLGEEMQAGFELFLEENDGKLGGRDVEVIVEDTEANAQTGQLIANKLLQEDDVDFGVGIVSSAVAQAVAPLFEDAQKPLLVAVSTLNALTGADKSDYVFRVGLSSYQAQYHAGQWIKNELDVDSLYLLAADYAGGRESVADLKAGFTDAGGKIAGEAFAPFGTTQDYQPFISPITGSGAEAVYAFFGGGEAVSFTKQYQQFGLSGQLPLIGGASLTSGDILEAEGQTAEGVYNVMSYVPTLDNPKNLQFVEQFEAKAGKLPSYFAVYPYDAAQLIHLALEATEGDASDGGALIAAMEKATIDSPRGPLSMDPDTHGTIQKMYMIRIEMVDGALAPVVVADLGLVGEQPE